MSAEGLVGRAAGTQHAQGRGVEHRQIFGQAGPPSPMPVFVPPAVFGEVQRVLDLPVVANRSQQLVCGYATRIATGEKIARVVKGRGPIRGNDIAVHAQGDATTGKTQPLANVVGVFQVEPQPPPIYAAPLFSAVSAAGRRV